MQNKNHLECIYLIVVEKDTSCASNSGQALFLKPSECYLINHQFSAFARSLKDKYENIIYDLITELKLFRISTNKKQKIGNMEKGVVGGKDAVLAGIRAADARNFGDADDADRTLSQLRVASSIAPDQLIWILD